MTSLHTAPISVPTGKELRHQRYMKRKQKRLETAREAEKDRKAGKESCPHFRAFKWSSKRKEWAKMPVHAPIIFAAVQKLIDNPFQFPSLIKNKLKPYCPQVRASLAKVLIVLLEHTDYQSGRIGKAVPGVKGWVPVTHDYLMQKYTERFGEYISQAKWYRCKRRLELAGFLACTPIKVDVDGDGTTRSAASYKQFTTAFWKELKVYYFPNIQDSIQRSAEKARKNGISFEWVPYELLANAVVYRHKIVPQRHQAALRNHNLRPRPH